MRCFSLFRLGSLLYYLWVYLFNLNLSIFFFLRQHFLTIIWILRLLKRTLLRVRTLPRDIRLCYSNSLYFNNSTKTIPPSFLFAFNSFSFFACMIWIRSFLLSQFYFPAAYDLISHLSFLIWARNHTIFFWNLRFPITVQQAKSRHRVMLGCLLRCSYFIKL